ncbi:BufA1 family periplasmic bufferin-type metallophore [Kordiimonas pumila]|uniref:DUF2282 domain-containing protein n=1 Tax=Kordiimonas pumila TaxID=2161677 RepID=A0ABV7D2J4_9PROT|nr:DUF2282 domain-containing protein [Kordiimonas pumila]
MKVSKFAKSAFVTTSAVAFAMTAAASIHADDEMKAKKEKCYGVVAKGMNDCGTSTHSCAGQSAEDAHPEEWVYVPAGMCDRLAGGSKEPAAM